MKITTASSIFVSLMVASTASLAASGGFSCERIKEKGVRESCIKERVQDRAKNTETLKLVAVEKEKAAEREKEQLAIAEAKRATDEFVNKSKQLITQDLKDPDSAKFTNLVIAQGKGQKLLCGSVNAKNSYGGYVGAKKFYVLWSDTTPGKHVTYTEGDEVARASARIDELSKVGRSSGLSAQIAAAQEGDRVLANARVELAQNQRVLSEQCIASPNIITVLD